MTKANRYVISLLFTNGVYQRLNSLASLLGCSNVGDLMKFWCDRSLSRLIYDMEDSAYVKSLDSDEREVRDAILSLVILNPQTHNKLKFDDVSVSESVVPIKPAKSSKQSLEKNRVARNRKHVENKRLKSLKSDIRLDKPRNIEPLSSDVRKAPHGLTKSDERLLQRIRG